MLSNLVLATLGALPPIPNDLTLWGRFVQFMSVVFINWGFIVSVLAIFGIVGFFSFHPQFHNEEAGLFGNIMAAVTELIDRLIVLIGIALVTASGSVLLAVLVGIPSLAGLGSNAFPTLTGNTLIVVIATVVSIVAWFAWKRFYHLAHSEQSWWMDLALDGAFALMVMFLNFLAYGPDNTKYNGAQIVTGFFERWLETVRAALGAFGVTI